MTIAKRSMRSLADKVYVRALSYIIKPKEKTRILGYIISNNLSHDCYINHIISKINFRMHVFCKIKQYLPANYRKTLNTATILSLFYYVSPLLINCTTKQLSTLNTLLLKAARVTIGSPCFKWSTLKILNSCKWPTIYQLLTKSSLSFIHSIVYNRAPKSINKLIEYNLVRSNVAQYISRPQMIYTPLRASTSNTIL